MPTFFPPVDNIVPTVYVDGQDRYIPAAQQAQRVMSYHSPHPRGRNVYLLSNGTYTETQPWDPDGTLITKIYFGGHANPLTTAEVTALTAAGYGAYIS